MSQTEWITIAIAIVGGILIGGILYKIIYTVISSEHRPEALRSSAKPLASLGFSVATIIGLITALNVFSEGVLEKLSSDLIDFIPRALVATIILIAANVIAAFAETFIGTATARMPLGLQQKIQMVVKGVILGLATILAITQLGVDASTINIIVAAICFALAGSFVLLVGVGGTGVARQVAAGKAIKKVISVGDTLTLNETSGEIAEIHSTHIEVHEKSGKVTLIPTSRLMEDSHTVERNEQEA